MSTLGSLSAASARPSASEGGHVAPARSATWLRRALAADALTSFAVGVSMVAAAVPLAGLLGLDATLLRGAGWLLAPFVVFVGWLASRKQPPRAAVLAVIALNVAWAIGCIALLAGAVAEPTLLGALFIGLHIVTVLAFAELEFVGLRRAA